jgi:hypothetical protein
MKNSLLRVTVDLDQTQADHLDLIIDHMGKKMGNKVSKAFVFRSLMAGYMRQQRLIKQDGEDESGKDQS